MVATIATIAMGGAASAAPIESIDPMHSDACRRALETLQAQENAEIAARPPADLHATPAPGSPIDRVRRNAARACLGGTGDPPPPKAIALPPIVVSPIGSPRLAPAAPLPAAMAPVAPQRRTDPPVFISTCDAGGCWASDGTRLLRAGAWLIGPRGLCSGTQGTPLSCP